MRRSWGRRADGNSIAYWHAQNLNEREMGPDGPMFRHGRAWLHWSGWRARPSRLTFTIEWCVFRRDPWPKIGFEINQTFGSDYDLSTTLALPWIGALYTHIEGLFPARWKGDSRNFSVSLYGEYLWIEFFWCDPAMTWGENKNRFPAFRLSFDWLSALFGKQQHRLEYPEGEETWHPITIPMPEGHYQARYRIERRTWWRARWPRKLVRTATDIDLKPCGVPIPGKGENSWDCGEDAIMEMGCVETDAASVIAAVVKSAISTRSRYETLDWRPKGRSSEAK